MYNIRYHAKVWPLAFIKLSCRRFGCRRFGLIVAVLTVHLFLFHFEQLVDDTQFMPSHGLGESTYNLLVGLPACKRSPIQVLTGPDVD